MIEKLLIVGYGRSGKDEAGQHLGRITNLKYGGSTSWAGLKLIAHHLGVHPMEAWETRHQCRQVWKDFFDSYRRTHKQHILAWEALCSGDIITGVRDKAELEAVKKEKLVDWILWIDRPKTSDPTVTFSSRDCDEVLFNDTTCIQGFHDKLSRWADRMKILKP